MAKRHGMPQIDVSESLLAALQARAAVGHGGNINDYLHSFLGVGQEPVPNNDRTVLDFIRTPEYAAEVTPAKKYLALVNFLYAVDPVRFASLGNFTIPGSQRILLSSGRTRIERSAADARVVRLKGADFYAASPRGHEDARDLAVHLMRALGYPLGVWQAVKVSMANDMDLSALIDI